MYMYNYGLPVEVIYTFTALLCFAFDADTFCSYLSLMFCVNGKHPMSSCATADTETHI